MQDSAIENLVTTILSFVISVSREMLWQDAPSACEVTKMTSFCMDLSSFAKKVLTVKAVMWKNYVGITF